MNYKKLFESRPWMDEVDYQVRFWSNPIYRTPHLPLVLGAGTSSGKTTMTLGHLEMFYADIKNVSKKTLIIPAATKILRANFAEALENFNPQNFSYCITRTVEEAEIALNNPDCQVVIALPHTVTRIENLPKLEWFILDEAQEWYSQRTIQKILSVSNPTYQLLLSGTPFDFHRKKDDYLFFHVSVEELADLDRVHNPRIEVISTSYNINFEDYNNNGNLRSNKSIGKKKHREALWEVAAHMVKHLGLPEKVKKQFLANRATNKILSVFGELEPTIIYCSRTNQANEFYKIFNEMMPGQVLMSHSHNDDDSEEFKLFQEGNHKILISVNRGRIGFDMSELFNIVDFTMTTNVAMLLQLLGRLLRKSKKKKKQKVYYKVAGANDAGYIKQLMTGVLSLWMKELYVNYTGDAREIRIPRIKPTKPRGPKTDKQPTTRPRVNQRAISNFIEMGVLSLDFWKEVIHYNNDKFATIAWTTLDDVKRECYGIRYMSPKGSLTKELYNETVKKYKVKTYNQLFKINGGLAQKAAVMGWDKDLEKNSKKGREYTVESITKFIKDNNIQKYNDFKLYPKGHGYRNNYRKMLAEGMIDELVLKGKSGLKKGHKYDEATKKKLSKVRKQMWDNGHYELRDNTKRTRS